MDDKQVTVNELKKLVAEFVKIRGWGKFHTPRNLATSVVLESSELLELFQWDLKNFSSTKIKKDADRMEEIWKEMADIMIYLFALADILGIDVAKSVRAKLDLSGKKYPLKYFNKSDQDRDYYRKIKAKYRAGRKSR